jgi:type I restriction enzyme, S subunit
LAGASLSDSKKIPLGELLTKSTSWVDLDPETEYKEVRACLWGRGLVLRRTVSGSEIASSRRLRVRAGQFLISRIDARHGAAGIVPAQLDGAVVSNDYPTYDVDARRLLPEYLDWYSKTSAFVDACRHASEGTTNRVRLREDRFLGLVISVPPLQDQRQVAERVDRLALHVNRLGLCADHAISATLALLPAVSRSMLSRNWPELSLGDCCEAFIDYRGRTPPLSDSGVPHITSANIRNGRVNWKTSKYVSEETYGQYMTRGIPQRGDVLFTMEAPLGEAAALVDDRRFSLAQRTMLLRPRTEILRGDFLAVALMSPAVTAAIHERATGTTVKGIAAKRLRYLPIPVPPLETQARVTAAVMKLWTRRDDVLTRMDSRQRVAKALLPSVLNELFGDIV